MMAPRFGGVRFSSNFSPPLQTAPHIRYENKPMGMRGALTLNIRGGIQGNFGDNRNMMMQNNFHNRNVVQGNFNNRNIMQQGKYSDWLLEGTGQVSLRVGSWPSNRTNADRPPPQVNSKTLCDLTQEYRKNL